MSIAIARRIATSLNVKSESQIRSLNRALTEYVRLTAQAPTTSVPGSIDASQIVSGTLSNARLANTVLIELGDQTSVGAAGAASALPATPTGYVQVDVNGTTVVLPFYDQS